MKKAQRKKSLRKGQIIRGVDFEGKSVAFKLIRKLSP
jgi:hypothetical protein